MRENIWKQVVIQIFMNIYHHVFVGINGPIAYNVQLKRGMERYELVFHYGSYTDRKPGVNTKLCSRFSWKSCKTDANMNLWVF